MAETMDKAAATAFFSLFYGGQHYLPGEVKEYGHGWCINDRYARLSTYDFNGLTKLVLMAHKYAVRVDIQPSGPKMIKICIWQRKREGSFSERHPTIETAIQDIQLPDTIIG